MRHEISFNKRVCKYDDGFEGTLSRRFYRNLISSLKINNDDKILDVGCGTGTILYQISQRAHVKGYGIDISNEMLKEASIKCPKMNFHVGDCTALPFESNSFDTVIACMAYHHFSSQEDFRKEAFRVLKSKGKVYICDPLFPVVVRKSLNGLFKVSKQEAHFYNSEQINNDFTKLRFKKISNIKDAYVQVLIYEKP